MNTSGSPWTGRRVLVTGCTGFLGGAVARELLARGAEVVGLIHERPAANLFGPGQGGKVHLVRGRADNVFRLHSAMAIHEVAAVFHLSAADPFAEDRCAEAVAEAARLYSRRMPVVAARPLKGVGLLAEAERPSGLTVARFGEVFGPGDRKVLRAVPATALGVHAGEGYAAPPDGPPKDFVFVPDAARALLAAAEDAAARGPGDYPFRSGWLLTDRQMASAVRASFAGRPPALPDSAPPANPLGWSPAGTLADALVETLAWYEGFLRTGSEARAAA